MSLQHFCEYGNIQQKSYNIQYFTMNIQFWIETEKNGTWRQVPFLSSEYDNTTFFGRQNMASRGEQLACFLLSLELSSFSTPSSFHAFTLKAVTKKHHHDISHTQERLPSNTSQRGSEHIVDRIIVMCFISYSYLGKEMHCIAVITT